MREKARISADQAKAAVNSVVEFVKGKLPVVDVQLQRLLSYGGDGGNPLSGAADALKMRFGF